MSQFFKKVFQRYFSEKDLRDDAAGFKCCYDRHGCQLIQNDRQIIYPWYLIYLSAAFAFFSALVIPLFI